MKKLLPIALLGLLSIAGGQAQNESGNIPAAQSAAYGVCLTNENSLLRADDTEELWIDYAADSYAGGSGTEADPYLIETPEQLAKLVIDTRNENPKEEWELSYEGVYFKQTADIDLSSRSCRIFNIGNGTIFSGIYDGNNYKIKGYHWNSETAKHLVQQNQGSGLFLNTRNAIIKNVIFVNYELNYQWTNISKSTVRLSPLGYGTINSQFINCITDGIIKVSFKNVEQSHIEIAGLIGYASDNTIIDRCVSKGSIECSVEVINGEGGVYNHCAGIVPQAENSTIINCTNLMDIKTTTSGANDKDVVTRGSGMISWCKNTKLYNNCNHGNLYAENVGTINAEANWVQVGGIASCIIESEVQNCWNTADVTRKGGKYYTCGSILGYWENSKYSNCYFNKEAANADGPEQFALTSAYMKSPDFVELLNKNLPEGAIEWVAVEGEYPVLKGDEGEDDPSVANAEIEKAFTLRTLPGGIVINCDQPVQVNIYTFRGVLQASQLIPAGSSTIALPEGLYIVKAGRQVEKVAVK